jgi:hypothetical protein
VLQCLSDIGDGDLHRVIRDVQRRQWDPSLPDLNRAGRVRCNPIPVEKIRATS